MKRLLVTGATGFLGGRFCRKASEVGYDVIATGRSSSGCAKLQASGIDAIQHDLTQPIDDEIRNKLGKVDHVVHCAALSAPFGRRQDFVAANVTATRNLLDFCAEAGIKHFLYISTPSVYFEFIDRLDVRETVTLPKPVNTYSETKRFAELMVLNEKQVSGTILRPRGIYGKGDTALLPRLLRAAEKRPLPVFRKGRAKIDLTYVGDVVDAMILAVSRANEKAGEIYNISGGEVLPIREIVDQVCSKAGVLARWKKMPLMPALSFAGLLETGARMYPGNPEPFVTRYSLGLFAFEQSLDISKAKEELNWEPKVSFEEGLEKTFSENGDK